MVPQETIRVKLSDSGQATVPARFRGDEDEYLVQKNDDGDIVFHPVSDE